MLPELITEARATLTAVGEPDRRDAHRIATALYELVRAHAKRIGALDQSLTWQRKLAAIKEEVASYEVSNRETFAARQTGLRALLSQDLGVPADRIVSAP